MAVFKQHQTVYERLGVRPLINARGAITTVGGSIMAQEVVDAMIDAGRHYVDIKDLQEKVGIRIAELTGSEAAFVSSGAASGMFLAGAACLTGLDEYAVASLPKVNGSPNEFIISMVDEHYYIHQGFQTCGGKIVKIGTKDSVSVQDYENAVTDKTAALVFFLGKQPKDQLHAVIKVAHERGLPIIVDAAAQLPPKSNLTDICAMGADLVVFSGGKGLRGPQCTGIVIGRSELVRACSLNSSPNSAIGRSMKVGKEELAGILTAIELFMVQDEEELLIKWEDRCSIMCDALTDINGVTIDYLASNRNPEGGAHAPASPVINIHFSPSAKLSADDTKEELERADPPIAVEVQQSTMIIGPMGLEDGQAEIVGKCIGDILI